MKEVIFLLFIVLLVVLFMLPSRSQLYSPAGATAGANANTRASANASTHESFSTNNSSAGANASVGAAGANVGAVAVTNSRSKRWSKRAQTNDRPPASTQTNSREALLVQAGIRVPSLLPQVQTYYNSASVVDPATTILRAPGSPRKRGANTGANGRANDRLTFAPVANEVVYDVVTGAPIAKRAHIVAERAKPSYT